MKYRIMTPNKIYNGVTEGILFTNGEATVEEDWLKNLFTRDYGYTAEEIKEETSEEKKPTTVKK
ncbi:hypothetical protein GJ688_13995 [Heliobacillus mobilis]|uniref:Uncharacterized protein n=1 Tax=Heliobacterium mobile TaxID=28064 RepID=A0A6I3SMA2_HELMO|nr:hypothetical protein [Heliobacterium mobile]MTV50084.1 hypothetical protein [Heliobacterium mobile]